MINGTISRRQFLHRLGAIGGAGITLGAMEALGLSSCASTKVDYHAPSPVDFSPNEGAGVSVLILRKAVITARCWRLVPGRVVATGQRDAAPARHRWMEARRPASSMRGCT